MQNPAASPLFVTPASATTRSDFWQRILSDEQLAQADALEKILAGCEIIAAVDSIDLLAA